MIEALNLEDLIPPTIIDGMSQEIANAILADIAEAARAHWIRVASEELFTSRVDYLAGIQPVEFGKSTAVIALVGVFPNMIENGYDERDMREYLLGPEVPVVKRGEGGGKHEAGGGHFYRSIPFRHEAPGGSGAVGMPMGRQLRKVVENAEQIGQAVYQQAKKLKATKDPFGAQSQLPAGLAPKISPTHKTDPFAGMIRTQKTYKKATQSQYATFRTISTAVQEGWIRPSTQGRHFGQKAREFATKIAPMAFEAYVKKLEGK